MGKDSLVAQRREVGIGRDVAVGVDPRGLDAAIPDIAVDIVREIDRRGEGANAQQDRRSQDHRECRPTTLVALGDKVSRDHPDNTLQQRGDDEAGEVTIELRRQPKRLNRQHQ